MAVAAPALGDVGKLPSPRIRAFAHGSAGPIDSSMRLRIFTEPQQGATYDDLLAVARTAEELGFDAFFRSDHYLRMGDGDAGPGPTDAWVTLAGLARETSRVRLGTLVTAGTFRLPGPLAIAVAQVDAMSGGRVELGIGAGWFEDEHRAHGIPFPPTRERFDRLEEQLAIITGMWTTPVGERFSYHGRYYELTDSPALPKPVQRPHPPIIIGGYGTKRTPALAARYAAGVQPGLPAARRIPRVRRPGAAGVRGLGTRPGDAAHHGRARRLLRARRSRVPAARGRHRPRARRAARRTAPPDCRARSSTSCARSRRRAPRPCTSRSSTFGPRAPRADRGRGHARGRRDGGRGVKFGVHAGLQNTTTDELRGLWRRIEDHGFDWISVWDHFYAADATGGAVCLEAVATHAALALETERVRCGSLVYSVGYRHPAVLANAMATLDHLAGGRIVLGLGGGWHQGEYDAYGIPFPPVPVRLRMLDEAHPVHPRAAHRGRRELRRRVLPAARRAVRAEARAGAAADLDRRRRREGHAAHRARHADGWNVPFIAPDTYRHKVQVLDEHCDAVGRDPATITKSVNLGAGVAAG